MRSGKSWPAFWRELAQAAVALVITVTVLFGAFLYLTRDAPRSPGEAIDRALKAIEEQRK